MMMGVGSVLLRLWRTPSAKKPCVRCFEIDARACGEARYRCGKATLVFVHVHKGGGSTFVAMARGNRAGLARHERNGDPVSGSERHEWWRKSPARQARWFHHLRQDDVRFIATEKGFPSRVLPPGDVIYAIVVRSAEIKFTILR